jgi:polar amino acid transport system substrate-binding protein
MVLCVLLPLLVWCTAAFVLQHGGTPQGLSVDVWRAVAARADVRFKLVEEPNVSSALAKVHSGQLDVAVGPISITAERSRSVRFTQPYFQASLAILAPERGGLWSRFAPFASRAFAAGVGVLLLVLLFVGTLLWLAERNANPEQFPHTALRGIGNGIWLALVTMTTVGYGDRAPVSFAGRVIAGVWMVIALISASSLTAGIATALTLSQLDTGSIQRIQQLSRRRVAVVRGTTGARLAEHHGARLVETSDLQEAVRRVTAKKADAVVFDRPMLQYYLRQHPSLDLQISTKSYEPQGYGFALTDDPALQHRLSVALLELGEQNQLGAIIERWLGENGGG